MIKAIDRFQEFEEGIRGMVKAAEIYTIHVMSKIRDEDLNLELINSIMSGKKMSGFRVVGNSYKKSEIEYLEKEGHFKEIGQQIIVSVHTALESYLIIKFGYVIVNCWSLLTPNAANKKVWGVKGNFT